ncbi:hypothetical protein B1A99_28430 [Cohnella sp. CIP 111063]|uniref:accessory gene regulator B family protein n=1 Tax=unclassified Cohnella TaxID=2636738 RepID=UPI000B8C68CE|nr:MULTISPECIES: accessory gene regulator B family protein [unclassified Cohnella]OXS53827.1 hypothetical protein B1A99_28430 [Cohnella sp. CIP 111063]PRX62407.1 accessory gene regulator B [Cohnella sp. SGD-V74]
MIESLALRIAESIKRADPDNTASVAVMKFSLEGIIQTLLTVLFIGTVGVITGTLGMTMLGALAFVILRFFSGGLHLRKAMHCSLLSTILLSIAPHISLNASWTVYFICINLVIIMIFAPSNIEGHARIPKKYFPLLKLISLLIIGVNFFFLSSTIAIAHFFQAVSTISLKRR